MQFQMSGEDFRDMGLSDPDVELMGAGYLRRMAKRATRNKLIRATPLSQVAKRMGAEGMGAGFLKRMVRKTTNVTKQAASGVATAARTASRSKLVKDVAGAAIKTAIPQLDALKSMIPANIRKAGNAIADKMPKSKAKAKPVAALAKVPRTAEAALDSISGLSMPAKVGIGVGAAAALILVAKAMGGKKAAA